MLPIAGSVAPHEHGHSARLADTQTRWHNRPCKGRTTEPLEYLGELAPPSSFAISASAPGLSRGRGRLFAFQKGNSHETACSELGAAFGDQLAKAGQARRAGGFVNAPARFCSSHVANSLLHDGE